MCWWHITTFVPGCLFDFQDQFWWRDLRSMRISWFVLVMALSHCRGHTGKELNQQVLFSLLFTHSLYLPNPCNCWWRLWNLACFSNVLCNGTFVEFQRLRRRSWLGPSVRPRNSKPESLYFGWRLGKSLHHMQRSCSKSLAVRVQCIRPSPEARHGCSSALLTSMTLAACNVSGRKKKELFLYRPSVLAPQLHNSGDSLKGDLARKVTTPLSSCFVCYTCMPFKFSQNWG